MISSLYFLEPFIWRGMQMSSKLNFGVLWNQIREQMITSGVELPTVSERDKIFTPIFDNFSVQSPQFLRPKDRRMDFQTHRKKQPLSCFISNF
jgi:hypothetical protein